MWNILILLGAPGAGKGTTAAALVKQRSDWLHVSTGNMLRDALKSGTQVGLEAKQYMEKGELVPDAVVMRIVGEHLRSGPADATYLFDGFPRTDEQAQLLDQFLSASGEGIVSHAFLLEVAQDILVERIAGRIICRDCGAVYHLANMPPKVEGVCDLCGGELYQRADDNRETVRNRLEVYERQTASLISYYREQGVLKSVDGLNQDVAVKSILEAVSKPPRES